MLWGRARAASRCQRGWEVPTSALHGWSLQARRGDVSTLQRYETSGSPSWAQLGCRFRPAVTL